jgi:glucose-1-phosphate thymidylyltransferase
MARAGVCRAFLILRSGKWDIPAYFGDGSSLGVSLGYLMMGSPHGPAYTIDQAYPFVRGARVVFGFGDILYSVRDPFSALLDRQITTHSDIVLGLFRSHDPFETDMIEVDRRGRVLSLLTKPGKTDLKWTWLLAVWNGAFTEFLHRHLECYEEGIRTHSVVRRELIVGDAFRAAIEAGLSVQSLAFPRSHYVDLGTPSGLRRGLAHQFAKERSKF